MTINPKYFSQIGDEYLMWVYLGSLQLHKTQIVDVEVLGDDPVACCIAEWNTDLHKPTYSEGFSVEIHHVLRKTNIVHVKFTPKIFNDGGKADLAVGIVIGK